ncbi:MAG TPA: hypothetical protein PKO06_08210 [Candidatus Ozemobacteraceae bacterium]|nr:hypothetical protein [Candidatus Ozemobacteraceae bacterium]
MKGTPELFFTILQSMTRLWENLSRDNRAFLDGSFEQASIQALLDQRELVLEENRILEQRFLEEWRTRVPEHPLSRLSEALTILEQRYPAGTGALNAFRQALEQLIESDGRVQEKLRQQRLNIETQIKSLKRSSTLVKGYKQASPFDSSCFIDKIR